MIVITVLDAFQRSYQRAIFMKIARYSDYSEELKTGQINRF